MKYTLTDEAKEFCGKKLHRVVCLKAFASVAVGETGGWVESENNLSQDGNAWVYGNAQVSGDARVMSEKDYIVLKNTWSSGRYFTYTASNGKWSVGCFYGTGEELVDKAFNDSELSGKCYKAAVKFVEELERIKASE